MLDFKKTRPAAQFSRNFVHNASILIADHIT